MSYFQIFLDIMKNVGDDHEQLVDKIAVVYNLFIFGHLTVEDIKHITRFTKKISKRGLKTFKKEVEYLFKMGSEQSGANLIMADIPKYAKTLLNEEVVVDSQYIFDTLEHISLPSPEKVLRMSIGTYFVFYKNYQDAIKIQNCLKETFIAGKKITVYTVNPIEKSIENIENNSLTSLKNFIWIAGMASFIIQWTFCFNDIEVINGSFTWFFCIVCFVTVWAVFIIQK